MNGGYPPLTNKSALRFLHAEVFSSAARLKRGDDYASHPQRQAVPRIKTQ